MDESAQHVIDEMIAQIKRGRYLMTASFDGSRAGVVVESVQWLMNDPLLIGVSVRKGHEIDPLIRDSRSFAIGFIAENDRFISRRFGQRLNGSDSAIYVEGLDPFETLESKKLVTGSPILSQCDSWIDCEVFRRVDLENAFELFVGSVVAIRHQGQNIEVERSQTSEVQAGQ
ncbi:MAG: flavin reductase family protein [Phycisphaerales bacterium]|nr:flavin reductase family protein [Phycisphaerales bacterium]